MIEQTLIWTAVGVDMIGVLIILLGFVLAVVRFVPVVFQEGALESVWHIQKIRCTLGTYLVFALELMIVSDLLHTVVSRSLEDLYFLAAIVAIRTVIAYFLNKEIQEFSTP